MNRQKLVNMSKGGRGNPGVVSELNLGKREVKRVEFGLNRSVIACVQSVSLEMGGKVEEMRVLQSLPVGSANAFDWGWDGIVIERGMDDKYLFVAWHRYYGVFHTQRLSGQHVVGVFGGESCL